MVEKIHITQGKIEGGTYILLSTDKPPTVTSLNYGLSDDEINRMVRRRRTCKFLPRDFVPNPWTDWLKKDKNS